MSFFHLFNISHIVCIQYIDAYESISACRINLAVGKLVLQQKYNRAISEKLKNYREQTILMGKQIWKVINDRKV